MPFALIPEGFKLQKVTKLQQEAVDKYNSSQSTQAFLEGNAPAEMVKAVAIVVTPIVLAVLAKRGVEFAKEETEDILSAVVGTLGGVVSEENVKKLAEIIFFSQPGASAVF
jgi:hypothetical protein|tara:strand:- start:66 stop:398 length:333 start_codon:yes stop_codon:yes gene_type:complete